jgi:RNA polymerase sigma-70 factor (ECF subfamily)
LLSEQEIIEGCIKCDKAAQKALFDLCHQKLNNVCLRYSNSAQDAQDLMQDTLIKVYQKIGSFKGNSSLTSWICTIAVNTAMSNFRKLKKFRLVNIDTVQLEQVKDEDYTDLPEPNVTKAIEALRKLPEGYRMVLNLYAVENYSHQEIANELGISVGTSKSQLARARKKLREMVNYK